MYSIHMVAIIKWNAATDVSSLLRVFFTGTNVSALVVLQSAVISGLLPTTLSIHFLNDSIAIYLL